MAGEQQEKAIERLAAVLIDLSTGAVMHGRVPTRVAAMDAIIRVWTKPDDDGGGVDSAWRNAVEAARRIASELGLVPVDRALVEAVKRTREIDGGAVAATYCDGGVATAFGDACEALALAVLAATEPTR